MNTLEQKLIEPATATTSPNIRILQLDVLRGLAVLGIYWINIIVFALPSGSYYLPILGDELYTPEFFNWTFTEIFVEGTMRGLFSILFGASAMVFLDEAKLAHQGLDVVDRYYRRTLLLVLFGLVHSYFLLWPYDVLYAYGLLGLFLFPLRKLSPAFLVPAGCVLLISSHLTLANDVPGLLSDEVDLFQENDIPVAKAGGVPAVNPAQDEIKDIIDANTEATHYLSSYSDIFRYQLEDVIAQHSSVMYTEHVFDIGGMMLIGMALLKLGILSGQRTRRYYLGMAITGYMVGTLIRGIGIYLEIKYDFDLFDNESHAGIDYDIGRLPITLGHIGVIGIICQSIWMKHVTNALSYVGRLALTNYIMQTVISIFLFYGFGLALFNKLNGLQIVLTCLAVWTFQVFFSWYWLKNFKLGPLEWVWRSLIYGKRQALSLKHSPK